MLQLWQHYFLKSTHKLEVPAVCISGSLRVAKPRHSGAPRSIGAQFKVGRTAFSRSSGQRADEGGGGEEWPLSVSPISRRRAQAQAQASELTESSWHACVTNNKDFGFCG